MGVRSAAIRFGMHYKLSNSEQNRLAGFQRGAPNEIPDPLPRVHRTDIGYLITIPFHNIAFLVIIAYMSSASFGRSRIPGALCEKCGYTLSGLVASRNNVKCPECGTATNI